MKNDDCTIDSLIHQLQELREQSPLKGGTVVVVCLDDSGLEYQPVKVVSLDKTERPEEGALLLIRIDDIPALAGDFKISAHGKPQDTLPVTVTQNDTGEVFGVEIEIPGYGRPVYLERDPDTGHPVLYVSANPDSDDISHKIPLPPFDIAGS